MNSIENLNAEEKVAVGLVIAEKMFNSLAIEEPGYNTGREALDSSWKWLEGGNISGDELCNYIDSEDYIDVAEFANKEKDAQKQYAWYSVLDAVSYTTYQAYNKEGRRFLPQVIEIIDDETLITLCENAIESGQVEKENLNNIISYVSENGYVSEKNIKKDSLPFF